MNEATFYAHHMGHVALINSAETAIVAQRDAADWHWTARYNLDSRADCPRSRDNAKGCQQYTARVSRAVRVALGIEA